MLPGSLHNTCSLTGNTPASTKKVKRNHYNDVSNTSCGWFYCCVSSFPSRIELSTRICWIDSLFATTSCLLQITIWVNRQHVHFFIQSAWFQFDKHINCLCSWFRCSIYLPQNITARYRSLSKRPLIALILARGGSKGIRLKNLRFIGGVSLLARSLKVIHKSDVFEDVWVSTDHMDIAEEAFKCETIYSVLTS